MDKLEPGLIDRCLVHGQIRFAPNTVCATDNDLSKLIQLFHQYSDAAVFDPVRDIFGVYEHRNTIVFLMCHEDAVYPNSVHFIPTL